MEGKVRSSRLPWQDSPIEVRVNNTKAAYDYGFEAGFRGWDRGDPYASARHSKSYLHGYNDGNLAAECEITAELRRLKGEADATD